MMAIFFDRPATVFDHAPFELGARNLLTLGIYRAELAALGSRIPLSTTIGFPRRPCSFEREALVRGIYLKGEALETWRATRRR